MWHLREWFMLCMFLLRAFACLGHECQVLVSACVHTLDLHLYSPLTRVLGMESKPVLTSREKSSLTGTQRRVEPAVLHRAGQAQHFTD